MLARTAQFRGHQNSCLPGYGAGVVGGGGNTDKLEWKEYKVTRRAFTMASPHFFLLESANMDVVSIGPWRDGMQQDWFIQGTQLTWLE